MRKKDPALMKQIRSNIDDYFFEARRMPTVCELADLCGISKSSVQRYLVEMDAQGLLTYQKGRIMTDKVDSTVSDVSSCPILGTVSCGIPTEEQEQVERYIPLPVSEFGGGELFILRADGESMIEAGIEPGDLVIIKKAETPRPRDIVVALVDGNENTLKRYMVDRNGRGYLHPENSAMKDMYFNDISVQGIAVGVMKKL